jgi:hypothetical protein
LAPVRRVGRLGRPTSTTRRPTTRTWAIIRRGQRPQQRASDRQGRTERRRADRASRSGRTTRAEQARQREMVTEARELSRGP